MPLTRGTQCTPLTMGCYTLSLVLLPSLVAGMDIQRLLLQTKEFPPAAISAMNRARRTEAGQTGNYL